MALVGLMTGLTIVVIIIFITVLLHRAIDSEKKRSQIESYRLGFMIAIAGILSSVAGIVLVTMFVPDTVLNSLRR